MRTCGGGDGGRRRPGMNVAMGGSETVNTLAETIGRLLGRPVHRTFEPPRPGDVKQSWADVSLARETLGFVPGIGFEQGCGSQSRAWGWRRSESKPRVRLLQDQSRRALPCGGRRENDEGAGIPSPVAEAARASGRRQRNRRASGRRRTRAVPPAPPFRTADSRTVSRRAGTTLPSCTARLVKRSSTARIRSFVSKSRR